jgi:hypothetical protein
MSQAGLATPQSALLAQAAQLLVVGEQIGLAPLQSALLRQPTQAPSTESQCGAGIMHWESFMHACAQR